MLNPHCLLCLVYTKFEIITTTKLDLKLDFSPSLLAVVHSSQANERSGDMSHVYDHFIFQEHIWNLQYILCNLMGSQIKGQATDDHNGTNVNGRSFCCSFDLASWYKTPFQASGIKSMNIIYVTICFYSYRYIFLIFFLITMHIEQFR